MFPIGQTIRQKLDFFYHLIYHIKFNLLITCTTVFFIALLINTKVKREYLQVFIQGINGLTVHNFVTLNQIEKVLWHFDYLIYFDYLVVSQ